MTLVPWMIRPRRGEEVIATAVFLPLSRLSLTRRSPATTSLLHEKYKFRGKKPRVIVAGAMTSTISHPRFRHRGYLFGLSASFVEIPSARVRREGASRKIERLPEISISAVCQNAGNTCEVKRERFCQVFDRVESTIHGYCSNPL